MLRDFFSLFFPRNCGGCGQVLLKNENSICTGCRIKLPRTRYEHDLVNPVYKLFAGKVNITAATSLFHFTKGGIVQNAMHELKYKSNQDIGEQLGQMMGSILCSVAPYRDVDYIVPVPLHPRKMKVRGYNQCDAIGRGMSEQMQVKMDVTLLQRAEYSESQTRKSRYERFLNVDSKFVVPEPDKIEGKSVLLIDDVVTTGSTLESCANALLQVPGLQVCIATVASA